MKGSHSRGSEHGQFVVFPTRSGYILHVEGVDVARIDDDDTETTQVCQCCEAMEDLECFTYFSVTVKPRVSSLIQLEHCECNAIRHLGRWTTWLQSR